jgi:nitrogen fixation protein NifU and related proteins
MDPRELYQELILDHGRHPRNFRFPEGSNRTAEGKNPLCGDHVVVKAKVENGVITEIGFQGSGCAISTAAASTMTEVVKGKARKEVDALFHDFHDLVTGKSTGDADALGKLAAFSGLSEFPMRVKCATLAWHTLEAALRADGADAASKEPVTTE